jgi:glycerol-3-phosphate acyltransferase PlsY
MLLILFMVIAFFVGSIPFSFIIGKVVKGIDLREHGSGNLGATNVFRNLGPAWGGICLFLDMAKGAIAVWLMTMLVNSWPPDMATPFHITPDLFRIFAGALAAVGHTFSPFVDFHGGKGVATTAGAFAVLAPLPILTALAAFVSVLVTTRYVSAASIAAATVLPVAVLLFEIKSERISSTIIVFTFLVCSWVIFKHRGNIVRLREGTETRVGDDDSNEVFAQRVTDGE